MPLQATWLECLRRVLRPPARMAFEQRTVETQHPYPEGCSWRSRQANGRVERTHRRSQVHQILRLGGSLDSTSSGRQGGRDEVDGQVSDQLSHVQFPVDSSANPGFGLVLLCLRLGRESVNDQYGFHGTSRNPF